MGAILLEMGGEVEGREGFFGGKKRAEGRWGVIERVRDFGILGVRKIDGRASRQGIALHD